jgi:hypothetical protein
VGKLVDGREAAELLGIEYLQFRTYEEKSKICYKLILGKRWYRVEEVARFKREVVDKL